MPCVVEIPLSVDDAALTLHPFEKSRTWIRGQNVKRRGLNSLLDGPFHGAKDRRLVILVHPEDEAPVHHDPQIVQPPHRCAVVLMHVLILPLLAEILGVQGFEADEETTQTASHGLLQKPRLQCRLDGSRCLPEATHTAHAVEKGGRELDVSEQMVVEKIHVASGKPLDLRKRGIHALGVEPLSPLEEGDLVAEIADVWAAA